MRLDVSPELVFSFNFSQTGRFNQIFLFDVFEDPFSPSSKSPITGWISWSLEVPMAPRIGVNGQSLLLGVSRYQVGRLPRLTGLGKLRRSMDNPWNRYHLRLFEPKIEYNITVRAEQRRMPVLALEIWRYTDSILWCSKPSCNITLYVRDHIVLLFEM